MELEDLRTTWNPLGLFSLLVAHEIPILVAHRLLPDYYHRHCLWDPDI